MHTLVDRMIFLLRFFRSPLQIGSITPSSAQLVQALLSPIPWERVNTAVELGAGTGVVTAQLKQRLHPDAKALIFEKDSVLRSHLRQNHPELHHFAEAWEMEDILGKQGLDQVDAIFSSLPFTNFSASLQSALLDQVRDRLTTDGVFTAYQYSRQIKPLLEERFQQVEIRWVPRNFPPAFVYICRKPIRPEERSG
ncbi:class I SAM-dependent methyltransferase [Desmospora activa]|uniref:Phospholipid N-methyltransferase n=1 Tax=Desmospora activa DSM 45169 TaxID=1121389 RepID=A0A2T4ZBX3_9BACL|nr:methyltransferase [Desmospora activa]PTM59375.1 phospholipid N-methyltransferase [Desmospora activa DSM 45169]